LKRVDIVIPSKNRREKLGVAIESIGKAKADDYDLRTIIIQRKDMRSFACWNLYCQTMQADAVLFSTDDVEFLPNGIEIGFKKFFEIFPDTDGILGFHQANIGFSNEGHKYAFGMMGKKFLTRFPNKNPFCPDYIVFCAETELCRYANSIGKYYFEEKAKLNHYHPSHGGTWDETGRKYRDPKLTSIDHRNSALRKQKGFLWGKN